MNLNFDSKNHIYSDEKGRLISITQIIDLYFRSEKDKELLRTNTVYRNNFYNAGVRGTKIHNITEKIDLGLIDYPKAIQLAGEDQGYIKSYILFLETVKPKIILCEKKIGDEELRFAGRLDRVYEKNDIILSDLKTPFSKYESWVIQVAAQAILLDKLKIKPTIFSSLQLKKDGSMAKFNNYKIEEIEEAKIAFISALKVYQWMNKN